MGQHPRTWFSSTTAGFPRADAAWLLRQISSLETPVNLKQCCVDVRAFEIRILASSIEKQFVLDAFMQI
jgi:hypothetical protein